MSGYLSNEIIEKDLKCKYTQAKKEIKKVSDILTTKIEKFDSNTLQHQLDLILQFVSIKSILFNQYVSHKRIMLVRSLTKKNDIMFVYNQSEYKMHNPNKLYNWSQLKDLSKLQIRLMLYELRKLLEPCFLEFDYFLALADFVSKENSNQTYGEHWIEITKIMLEIFDLLGSDEEQRDIMSLSYMQLLTVDYSSFYQQMLQVEKGVY